MQAQREEELIDGLTTFLRDYYKEDVYELANNYPRDQRSLVVDWTDVYQFDQQLASDLLEQPDEYHDYFEEALMLFDKPIDVNLSDANVRFTNTERRLDIADVAREEEINTMLEVKGQVKKASKVKPLGKEVAFECMRCGTFSRIEQTGDNLQEPHECKGCERQGPFTVNKDQSIFENHQQIRVQQPPEKARGGNAVDVDVTVTDDLVYTCEPGDRINLTARSELVQGEKDSPVFDVNLSAEYIEREESRFEDIDIDEHIDVIEAIANGEYGDPYELIIGTINPTHFGDEKIKLTIGLQMFGSWRRHYPDGSTDRGDIHVLLLGDPGCGKSTFLHYADSVAPRSTFASGKGATESGMTASAVKDDFGDGEWSLEAGALVMADEGLACIDEIDKMPENVRSSFHEALGEQSLNINKAGINATLPTRTSVLAAGNPKHGRFDHYEPIPQQIELGPPLMSRFDIMFMVSDDPDPETDGKIVEHMIESRDAGAKYTLGEELDESDQERVNPAIDLDVFRAYIAYAKQNCHPRISAEEVKDMLKKNFSNYRQTAWEEDDAPVPVTFRKVEAIARLAEASARVRLNDRVDTADLERAINLVETSMKQVGYDPESGEFDADIVNTGQSKSQRERIKAIKQLVRELQVDHQPGPSRSTVISEATANGLDADTVDSEIDNMLQVGELYRPAEDEDSLLAT